MSIIALICLVVSLFAASSALTISVVKRKTGMFQAEAILDYLENTTEEGLDDLIKLCKLAKLFLPLSKQERDRIV